jgi:putative transposase
MRIEYNNLYTHFIFVTLNRLPLIQEQHQIRIEKYITGIVNNNDSKLYAIYVNPEHTHILLSRSPKISEEDLATIIAKSSLRFINENKLCVGRFTWQSRQVGMPLLFRYLNQMLIRFASIYLVSQSIIIK